MKKFLALIAAAAIAATMTACSDGSSGESRQVNGTAAEAGSAVHNYSYVRPDGTAYSGTYTGDWENNMPNGDGSYEGSADGISVTITGSWSNGQPNGQCRYIEKDSEGVYTYNGNLFFGAFQGNGDFKGEDLNGNLILTYSGEWKDNIFDGNGELVYYFTAEAAAESGFSKTTETGYFTNGSMNGEATLMLSYTEEYAASLGVDYVLYTGQMNNNALVEPYRYAFYKNNQIVEEGRVRDGNYINDSDKAVNDAIYDALDNALGDGILGGLFDIIAPEFYDRNAE